MDNAFYVGIFIVVWLVSTMATRMIPDSKIRHMLGVVLLGILACAAVYLAAVVWALSRV